MVLTFGHLKEIWGPSPSAAKINYSDVLGPVCTDTRRLVKGDFFIPLIGENFNGHNFIPQAYRCGAQGLVIDNNYDQPIPKEFIYWRVPDTLNAYQQLALLHRRDLSIPVIAITGSAGKTTTRELIRSVLTPLGLISSSEENNNNDVGVPLTLLKANASNSAIVLEMGMRGLGEIRRLSCCSEPDIAVITNVGTAHIGRLGSRENIALAKCEITSSLKSSGVVIIPANDQLLEKTLNDNWKGRVVRVGIEEVDSETKYSADPLEQGINLLGKVDLKKCIMQVNDEVFRLPLPGRHNAKNLIIAIAVAKEFGISFNTMSKLRIQLPEGRSSALKIGDITVLDETYNSSPEAVKSSLELLANTPGRHFAVLGTMLELGEHSMSLHREVVEYASKLGLDGLVVVAEGKEADVMKLEAKNFSKFEIASTPEKALVPLRSWLRPGDTVLLKASRAIALEKLLFLMKEIYS